jgi:hypothetical protein
LYNDPELGDHTIVYKWDDNLQPYVSDIWLRPGYPVKINNQGQILHHWWPSLGGLPARYTPPPGPGWEAFDFVETVQGMNEHGTIVGRTWVKRGQLYATRPNGGTDAFYRFTDPNQVDILLTGNVWTGDGGVNNVGDACGRTNVRDLFVYTDRDGLLWVNNLVIGNDSDIAVWMSMYILAATGITDRDAATGFGQICCWGSTAAGTEIKYTAFLLTPMKP